MTPSPAFDLYVGIDYSGAETPSSSLKRLRVFAADRESVPVKVLAPASARKYWTRLGLAEWLVQLLRGGGRSIVGIDRASSFPRKYFEAHGLPHDWDTFLDDFQRHWPTDDENVYVDFVREGLHGDGPARVGDPRWKRATELRSRGAKSVFHFDVQGQVAKATHAGLPWLRYLRSRCGSVHFWPFDGWFIPPSRSVIVEVYPALWNRQFPCEQRNQDQHDAWSASAWLRQADLGGTLTDFLAPPPDVADQDQAPYEGWILGVK